MRWTVLVGVLVLFGSIAHAQEPAQSAGAQSEIAACLVAQQPLSPIYRDTLEVSCLRVAGDSCERTEWPLACLKNLRGELRAAFAMWRPLLPETVPGTRLSQRTYPNRLGQVDDIQSDTSCRSRMTEVDLTQCEITQAFSALTGLLSVARVAEISLR